MKKNPDCEPLEFNRTGLLEWFDQHQREMPWRHTGNPYDVLVSEIMLQQTRVATVVDYFERWMARFPTIEILAAAQIEEILEHWSGLGYYRRARNLHKAAQEIRDRFQGQIPAEVATLRELPGIGPYTAGAIASIAFGAPAPLVDGNVNRVFTRHFAIPGDPLKGDAKRKIWALAKELIPEDRPGDFNQALMELGSEICRAKSPLCSACPVQKSCRAFAIDAVALFPEPKERKKPKEMRGITAILTRMIKGRRELLLRRRPEQGLLAGLWEFPTVEEMSTTWPSMEALQELLEPLQENLPRLDNPEDFALEVEHIFSHRRLLLRVYEFSIPTPSGRTEDENAWIWVAEEVLQEDRLATSALVSKIFREREQLRLL